MGAMTVISGAVFAAGVTGNQGDAGDPNNAIVSMAASHPKSVALPAPAFEKLAVSANAASTHSQPVKLALASPPTILSSDSVAAAASQSAPAQSNTDVTAAAAPAPALVPPSPSESELDPASASLPAQTAPAQTAPAQTAPAPAPQNALGDTSNSRTAFAEMVRNIMPLSPAQIITLRDMFNKTQKAVAQYPGVPPKPTSSSILVNMSPGATPPVIRLRAGYVTSLVFLDSTGQPWPVVGYDLGNPKAFNIQPTSPNGKSDTLILQSLVSYEQGNLAVMLKDENTPVMLTLMPGQRAVDYRVDLRIPGLGPNASVSMSGLPQAENPVLMNFLDGVPPSNAKQLTIEGAPAQAWSYKKHLFLRTRVTVLSPGWISSMSSPDGTHVYELVKTPIILASERGQMVQLSIKGL